MAGCLPGLSVMRRVERLMVRCLCPGMNRASFGMEGVLVVRSGLGEKHRRKKMQQGDENREERRDKRGPQPDAKPHCPHRSWHNFATIADGRQCGKAPAARQSFVTVSSRGFFKPTGFPGCGVESIDAPLSSSWGL
jgi:hypothetical protein